MSLGASARLSRPRGPAKFKDIQQRREAILGKWRDGTRECLRVKLCMSIAATEANRMIVEGVEDVGCIVFYVGSFLELYECVG